MKKISLVLIMLVLLSACAKNQPSESTDKNQNVANEEVTTNENQKTATNEIVNNEEEVVYSYFGENENFEARTVVSTVTEDYLTSLADEAAGVSSEELQTIMEKNPIYKVNVYLTYTGSSLSELPDITDANFKVSLAPAFEAGSSELEKEHFVKVLSGKEPLIKEVLIPEESADLFTEELTGEITGSSETMEEFNFKIELQSK